MLCSSNKCGMSEHSLFFSSLCNYISYIPIFIYEKKRNAFPFPFKYGLNLTGKDISEGLGLRLQPCFIFSLKLQNRQGLRP